MNIIKFGRKLSSNKERRRKRDEMKEHLLDEFEEEQEEYEIDKLEEIRRQYSGLLPLFYLR